MAAVELYSTPLYSDANLVAYYRFEGNANDSIGSNTGTGHNMTYGSSYGKFGEGGDFNGSNGYISVSDSNIPSGNPTFSVNAWIKYSSLNSVISQNVIIDWGSSSQRVKIAYNASGFDTQIGNTDKQPAASIGTGGWHMLTVTYDGTTATYYVDGVSVGTETGWGTPSVTGTTCHIGMLLDQTSTYGYNGYIDDLAVLSRVLTSTEISNLYSGTWGGGGTTYTASGAVTMMNAASRYATIARLYKALRSPSVSMMNAASRSATVSRLFKTFRTSSVSMMNSVSRSATAKRVWQTTRSAAATIMNAASRYATAGRLWKATRSATVSMMNAAARYASVAFHLPAHYTRTASVTMMNAASRYATVVSRITVVWVRTASVSMMNAASRVASATRSFIIKIGSTIRWNFFDWS